MKEFDVVEVVPAAEVETSSGKFISTRFVHTDDKSRFVSREFRGGEITDDHFAPATTQPTQRLIDFLAAKRHHAKLNADISRAFLHIVEDDCRG